MGFEISIHLYSLPRSSYHVAVYTQIVAPAGRVLNITFHDVTDWERDACDGDVAVSVYGGQDLSDSAFRSG